MQTALLFIIWRGSMVRTLFALLFASFAQCAVASDLSVSVAAPVGLISSQTIAEVERQTGLRVTMHTYQYSATVMTSLAIDPNVFDVILIDRSYVPKLKEAGMVDEVIAKSLFEVRNPDSVTESCPIYATGKTVLISNVQHDDDQASWHKVLNGEYGQTDLINFSSVTEAGEVLVGLLANEQCTTDSCVINSVSSSLRIVIAAGSQSDTFDLGSYSFVPDYLAKQIAQSNKNQHIYEMSDYNRNWAKHWCSLQSGNTDNVLVFLKELYRHESVTLNAQATQADITRNQFWHEDADLESFISYPGDEKHRLHSVVVGLGQALYAK